MKEYQYVLEPYCGARTRYECPNPNCTGKNFVRYIDTQTGDHVNSKVGRCNREIKCGYHYTPKQYFHDNNIKVDIHQLPIKENAISDDSRRVSFIPSDLVDRSIISTQTNHFVTFLIDLFGIEIAKNLIRKYFIGTSKLWNGATVFWQTDLGGNVRTGKIMLYDPRTGMRIKEPFSHISWVHKDIQLADFNLKQCLFGEHLLQDDSKHIAIVESEKTAIIASIYLPQFIWLAAGSLTSLNAEKCQVLKGRSVALFPDLDGFEKWSHKAQELFHITKFIVSDLLERKATNNERSSGLDIADYLVKFKANIVTEHDSLETIQHDSNPSPILAKQEIGFTPKNVAALDQYFSEITFQDKPIRLNQCTLIVDSDGFVRKTLKWLKAHPNNRAYLPYFEQLLKLKELLRSQQN